LIVSTFAALVIQNLILCFLLLTITAPFTWTPSTFGSESLKVSPTVPLPFIGELNRFYRLTATAPFNSSNPFDRRGHGVLLYLQQEFTYKPPTMPATVPKTVATAAKGALNMEVCE
jgi:hypothetical protein